MPANTPNGNQTSFVITYHHSNGNTSTLTTRQSSWDVAQERAQTHMHRAIKAGRISMIAIKPAQPSA